MPDLTTTFFAHCETAEDWATKAPGSKPGVTYAVAWSRDHKNQSVQFDYSCSCPAYKHQPGYCKHIKKVVADKLRCGWMQFMDGDAPIGGACPKCSAPTRVMGWGV